MVGEGWWMEGWLEKGGWREVVGEGWMEKGGWRGVVDGGVVGEGWLKKAGGWKDG